MRHLNDDLAAAQLAVALNQLPAAAAPPPLRPFGGVASTEATSSSLSAGGGVDVADVYSGNVKLAFKGSRVFVFKIFSSELPVTAECIRYLSLLLLLFCRRCPCYSSFTSPDSHPAPHCPFPPHSIQDRLYIIRGSLSRLLWPESTTSVSAALKQNPLKADPETVKTESLVLNNLPALQNEVLQANLYSIKVVVLRDGGGEGNR